MGLNVTKGAGQKTRLNIKKILFVCVVVLFILPLIVNVLTNFNDIVAEIKCNVNGGHIQRVGFLGSSSCVHTLSDGGKQCYTNDDCLSKKCVIEKGRIRDGSYLVPDTITSNTYGKCSSNDQDVCWTGEILIESDRSISDSCYSD